MIVKELKEFIEEIPDDCLVHVIFRVIIDQQPSMIKSCTWRACDMQANNCRWLDRYFGTVCRNQNTHPNSIRLDDGTIVFGEPTCKRCEGCGYEPITPDTPAWDDDGEDDA